MRSGSSEQVSSHAAHTRSGNGVARGGSAAKLLYLHCAAAGSNAGAEWQPDVAPGERQILEGMCLCFLNEAKSSILIIQLFPISLPTKSTDQWRCSTRGSAPSTMPTRPNRPNRIFDVPLIGGFAAARAFLCICVRIRVSDIDIGNIKYIHEFNCIVRNPFACLLYSYDQMLPKPCKYLSVFSSSLLQGLYFIPIIYGIYNTFKNPPLFVLIVYLNKYTIVLLIIVVRIFTKQILVGCVIECVCVCVYAHLWIRGNLAQILYIISRI